MTWATGRFIAYAIPVILNVQGAYRAELPDIIPRKVNQAAG
jgi:hypothetical protein